jgi:acyl carrier protein
MIVSTRALADTQPHRTFDSAALRSFCLKFVAELLGRSPGEIDPTAKFGRIGFDSAMSVQLIVALEDLLGLELSPDMISDHPSIARLSSYLADMSDAKNSS